VNSVLSLFYFSMIVLFQAFVVIRVDEQV